MSDIKERLDKVRALIQEPEFLEGKGLSNEVNIRIFCYEPENEMVVRHFVNQLETDQSLDCHLIVCNLYKTFLSICDDMDITDAIPDMEEADGSAYLLEQLNSAIGNGEFIDKIQYEPHEPVPGAGKAELVFTDESGRELSRQTVFDFKGPGVVQAMHNRDASILSFISAFTAARTATAPQR